MSDRKQITEHRGNVERANRRVAFSANRRRLEVFWADPKDQVDYEVRWFNDQDDRIARARAAAYEFVEPSEVVSVGDHDITSGNTDVGSKVSRIVGRTDNNEPIRAYLMKIRKKYYREDQAAKEAINAKVDQAVRAGKVDGAAVENQYGDVEMDRRSRPF